jgi:hypothetical protein
LIENRHLWEFPSLRQGGTAQNHFPKIEQFPMSAYFYIPPLSMDGRSEFFLEKQNFVVEKNEEYPGPLPQNKKLLHSGYFSATNHPPNFGKKKKEYF